MSQSSPPRRPSPFGAFVFIAAVAAGTAGAFAYTAGWLSPARLTPDRMVQAFSPPSGPALGHRRNHAKGICFTGTFDATGDAAALSRATVFARGQYPATGRFNLGTPNPDAPDATARVRGMGLRIVTPDGQEWRAAMIDPPFFPVATPGAFYGMLRALGGKQPGAVGAFAAAHPEFATFGAWAKSAPWTGSYAEEPYNSLDAFIATDASGGRHAIRWSLQPDAKPVAISPDDLGKRGPDTLEQEITQRIHAGPARWSLIVTVADPGDETADPSKAWPPGRKTINAGTLIVQDIQPEANGPCRDINFDPTVLPPGLSTSDDPFPAARSAAYRVSYDLRTAEENDYPRTNTGAKP